MDENSSHAISITGGLLGLYTFGGIGFYMTPVLILVIFGVKEPWMPVFIPGIDINTEEGYIITSIYHYIVIYIACLGLGFSDGLFCNLIFNVLTMTGLQCNQFSQLNGELSVPKPRILIIRTRMQNLFKMYQEIEEYDVS